VRQEWQQQKIDTKCLTWIGGILPEISKLSFFSCYHLDEEGIHFEYEFPFVGGGGGGGFFSQIIYHTLLKSLLFLCILALPELPEDFFIRYSFCALKLHAQVKD
jgi:hypothetical protein